MKTVLFIFIALILMVSASAQESADTTYWKKGGSYAINFTQASFTNWAAGGQNAVAGVTKLNVFAHYTKGNTAWENVLNLGYGLSKVQGLMLQKNDDLIDLQSKLGIKANDKWFYSGLFSLKSQFAPGYSDATNSIKISNFFSPAYLTLAFGMDYKPNAIFSVVMAPLTGKMTIVNDKDLDGMFGVEAGKTTRMEMGASINTSITKEIIKNVGLVSNLGLFTNYLKNPEYIDVDWKLGLNMKVNSFLSANINTQLLYDADILDPVDQKAKIQFKELLGIGFNVKF